MALSVIPTPYIDLSKQHESMRKELLAAVDRVLQHGQFILGPEVGELEQRLAGYLKVPHVVAINSGTDALLLALRLRGIGPGDEVITVAHSFVATASAIVMVGAKPIFVEIDPDTMLLDPARLAAAVTSRTKAVICVHLNGHTCALDSISTFCRDHGLVLIEDCAQAIGAWYQGRSVGSFGIGCFSLHPLKALAACGDGGFVSVHSEEDAARLRVMRNIGLIDRDHCEIVSGNSRLDTVHAAMLLVKLRYLDQWLDGHRAHAAAYTTAFAGKLPLQKVLPGAIVTHTTFVVRVKQREQFMAALRAQGIDTKIHYPIPIHQQRAFLEYAPREGLPITERIVSEIVSLPARPEITAEQRQAVIAAVNSWIEQHPHS